MTIAEAVPYATKSAPWFHLPSWATRSSAMQEALSAQAGLETISFALGLPASELFPIEELAESAETVLRSDPRALQYGPPDFHLKSQIVELMAERGIECSEDQVFLTAGAQQGLLLLGRILLRSNDVVASEQTVYPGFRQVVASCGASLLSIPVRTGLGPDLDALNAIFTRVPKPTVYYTVPEGHNPLGISLDEKTRETICELAAQHQVPVIEDDPYGLLTYDQEKRRPLRALLADYVFYVGSFSKIIAPGLRVGWLVVPRSLVPALEVAKESADIHCATLSQRVISHFIARGHLTSQLDRLRSTYAIRRDAMVNALDEEMPPGCQYCVPRSGIFVWVELPEGSNAAALLRVAARDGVIALPGDSFVAQSTAYSRRCVRLAFSNNSPDHIREGIRRLANVIKRGITLD